MSLNRLFLRTAAVAALSPEAGDKYPPTMAGNRVHDSRIGAITADFKDGVHLPVIAVYTDDDEYRTLNVDGAGMAEREVILRIEFAIGMFDTIVEDKQKVRAFVYPAVDAEIEARLDMFEQQIRWALFSTHWRVGTLAVSKMVKKVSMLKSVAMRDEDTATKISSRMLLATCSIVDDCQPSFLRSNEDVEQGEFDLNDFPGLPWLGPMLRAMAADKNRHPIVDLLGNARTASVILPALERIAYNVDAIDPADPNLLAQQGKTAGPDGRIETSGILELDG